MFVVCGCVLFAVVGRLGFLLRREGWKDAFGGVCCQVPSWLMRVLGVQSVVVDYALEMGRRRGAGWLGGRF